jgi:phosphotransferase system HPr (HPr) family protein
VRRTFTIQNKLGLHARAAAQLVQLAANYTSELTISREDQEVNGKSIMGLMMLAASQGMTIDVEATGDDAEAMLDAIEALIEARFNEPQ